MPKALDAVLDLLDLEPIEVNLFRGRSPQEERQRVFGGQVLAQALVAGFEIGELSCPAAYFEDASSINFRRSVRYGLGVVVTSLQAFVHRKGLARIKLFDLGGRRLDPGGAPEAPAHGRALAPR